MQIKGEINAIQSNYYYLRYLAANTMQVD